MGSKLSTSNWWVWRSSEQKQQYHPKNVESSLPKGEPKKRQPSLLWSLSQASPWRRPVGTWKAENRNDSLTVWQLPGEAPVILRILQALNRSPMSREMARSPQPLLSSPNITAYTVCHDLCLLKSQYHTSPMLKANSSKLMGGSWFNINTAPVPKAINSYIYICNMYIYIYLWPILLID